MIEINLIEPKAEQMAMKNYFLLPFHQDYRGMRGFMIVKFVSSYLPSCYTLKKVIKLQVLN